MLPEEQQEILILIDQLRTAASRLVWDYDDRDFLKRLSRVMELVQSALGDPTFIAVTKEMLERTAHVREEVGIERTEPQLPQRMFTIEGRDALTIQARVLSRRLQRELASLSEAMVSHQWVSLIDVMLRRFVRLLQPRHRYPSAA